MLWPDADRRREVVDGVDAVGARAAPRSVAHVADDQLDVVVQVRGALRVGPVHLRREAVERAHAVARGAAARRPGASR